MDSLTNQQMSYLHSIIFILKHTKCHITADIKKFTFYNIYIKTIPFVPATLISMLFTFYNIYIKTKKH